MNQSGAVKAAVLGVATLSLSVASGVYSQQAAPEMSFFITSVGSGKGADLGGIEGATLTLDRESDHGVGDSAGGGVGRHGARTCRRRSGCRTELTACLA